MRAAGGYRSVAVRSVHSDPVEVMTSQPQGSPVRVPSIEIPSKVSASPRPASAPRQHSPILTARSSAAQARHIVNLENFERVPVHPKTIFDSPRSLEVCAANGIHATELLPRSIKDFLQPGVPEPIAAMRYNDFERRRREKLMLLRAARASRIAHQHAEPSKHPEARPRMHHDPCAGGDGFGAALITRNTAKRQATYERALRSRLDKEHVAIEQQLNAEQRIAARKREVEEERLRKAEQRRLDWERTRERVEHRRRQFEYFALKKLEQQEQDNQARISKYSAALARERYMTPQRREEQRRSCSATRELPL